MTDPIRDDEREVLARLVNDEHMSTRSWSEVTAGTPIWRTNGDDYAIREAYRAADAILAAGFRRQGPITDEWEYGIRPEDDYVVLGVSPMPSFEAAQTRANNIYGGWAIVRRRPVGPWEPAS